MSTTSDVIMNTTVPRYDWLDNVTTVTTVITDVIAVAMDNANVDMNDNVTSNVTNSSLDVSTYPIAYPVPVQPYYLRLAANLWTYGSPVLIIVGTIGNILSAIVMLRKKLRRSGTTTLYLAVLAFVDLAILYTGLLRQWLFRTYDIDVRSLSEVSCRLHPFILYALMQYQAWIIVNVTIERLAAIFLPHKTSIIFTRGRAVLCLSVMAIIIGCINFHFFFTLDRKQHVYKPRDNNGDGILDPTRPPFYYCAQRAFITKQWPWIHLVLFSFAPSAILIVCNFAIVVKMTRTRGMHERSAAEQSRISSMTVTLLVVSAVYLVTTAPVSIYLVLNEFFPKPLSNDKFNETQLAWAFVNLIVYTNNVANFFLYCISGTRFRREVIVILYACVCKPRTYNTETRSKTNTQTESLSSRVPSEMKL